MLSINTIIIIDHDKFWKFAVGNIVKAIYSNVKCFEHFNIFKLLCRCFTKYIDYVKFY